MADNTTQKYKAKEVTVPEIKKILLGVLKTNIVPFVWGPPGVGKSSIVKEIAAEKGWKLIDLRLSLLNPVDLRGLPTINHVAKEALWLPPSFLPAEDTKEPGLLFLDEINLAPLSVQAAAYQLILDKKVGDYKFPKTWKIVAAGNREVDKANVFKISAPLANRFVHFTVRPDFYSWKAWATSANINSTLINFLALRPAAIYELPNEAEKAFPSPRSWQFVSDMLAAFDYDEADNMPDDLVQVIMGAVGEGVGREVIEFFNQFKMKDIEKKLEEFIETGNITMPRQTSLRLTIIGAVFEAYVNADVDQVKYDSFKSKLSGEERATIEEFEKNNKEKIEAKNKNPNRMPQGASTELLRAWSDGIDNDIAVKDASSFTDEGTLLIIDPDGKKQQIVGYGKVIKLSSNQYLIGELKPANNLGHVFPVGSNVSKIG